MKLRILLVLAASAAAVAVTLLKRQQAPELPARPEGSWAPLPRETRS